MRPEPVDELAGRQRRALRRDIECGIFEVEARLERPDDDPARSVLRGGEGPAKGGAGGRRDPRAGGLRYAAFRPPAGRGDVLRAHPGGPVRSSVAVLAMWSRPTKARSTSA